MTTPIELWKRKLKAQIPKKHLRDIANRLRYGAHAALSDELIWVDPNVIQHGFTRPKWAPWRKRHSGKIIGGDWDKDVFELAQGKKFRACRQHFEGGVPWEDTGIYADMMDRIARDGMYDGCRTLDDVIARYAGMDELYRDIKSKGYLEPVSERPERLHREHGGILVHINRDGDPILGGNGSHRLVIAQILKLPQIPACLGVLHQTAWETGALKRLRRKNKGTGPMPPDTEPTHQKERL